MLDEHAIATRLVLAPVLLDPDESDIRELWMPPALLQTLTTSEPRKSRDYAANVRAFLGRFVKHDEIDNCRYMKCWSADVFELRVQLQARNDRIRIFGAFGELNTFVAFFRRPRNYFGGRNDPRWNQEIQRAVDVWDEYFPGKYRLRARPVSNCVTNGVDVPAEECL